MESGAQTVGTKGKIIFSPVLKAWGKLVEVRDRQKGFNISCGKRVLKAENLVEKRQAFAGVFRKTAWPHVMP